ncbi:TatD family hydrolase [Robiginitalea sp.]|nr:TatD family hydrolase [Robiginitalea sp.]
MILTDTHTHLYVEEFDSDRDEVIRRAIDLGISRFFLPAIDSSYVARMKELKDLWPNNVRLMTGLHPTYVKDNWKEELGVVQTQLETGNYVGVGEIGIDLYWDKSRLLDQIRVFRTQIEWALAYDLPIVIHCREAFHEIFETLENYRGTNLRGIFHCFTGNLEQAELAISYGMKLGIGGVVTFKNGKLDTFINRIPLDQIVLETDAPYLAPVPFRGKRNEPSYLRNVLTRLSELYGESEDRIADITTANSIQIFGC